MKNIHLKVKPISVNTCWQGRRFKTDTYKAYEKELLLRLPPGKLPPPPYKVSYEFGLSNFEQSDYDNPIKPLQDILSKKYGFNDAHIHEATIRKVKVGKGAEYFTVLFETI